MFDKRKREMYYVSNLATGKVAIIDGDSYSIIKEIEVGPRPQNIIVDEKNNVYIASDRNSKITVIHDLYEKSKEWYIPNNGNIEVDFIAQKLYVCDTEEVYIYSLRTGEKVGCINGFIAADSLALDKDKKRLFVLDILQKDIKVYDTLSFHLIKRYKDVGFAPSYMRIGEEENYIYIANKGTNKGKHTGIISILDLKKESISYIDLEEGSSVTYLEQSGALLYGVNAGLHRIEVIDILKRKLISTIKTTLPKLQKIKLSYDKKILLATSVSDDGKGVVDRIDTSNNIILNTLTFEENNSRPCHIGVVTQSKLQVGEDAFILADSQEKFKRENGTTILAKKVISTYQEKLAFQRVPIEVPAKGEGIINIERITFQKCEIISETKRRKIINSKKEYSILQYDFCIPYCIEYKDEQEEKYIMEGKLEGMQKATLYIPPCAEQKGVEFTIDSFASLMSTSMIINKNLKFDVSVLISTKAVVEEMVFIPFCKNCEGYQVTGKRKEGK